MPTLGFLKKKKTKEHDQHSSNDNSPVTPTSASGHRSSLTSTSANTLSSSNSSNKGGETMLVNHGGPQPTSAPRSAGQDAPTKSEAPVGPGMSGLADGSAIQSQIAGQANGSSLQPSMTDASILAQTSTNSSAARTTKGKYSLTDFDIKRTLGTGSFGRVHLVQSKHNQRFYAVKVLKKAQVVKMKQVEHTNDERKMLQKVKHTFLVTLWGTFQDSKNLYMVMDFVEGGELFSLLRKSQVSQLDYFEYYHQSYTLTEYLYSRNEKRFPNPVAKFYAAEVTLALDYLHLQGIIYRDLKPENLLLDRHGHLKITDFGFAKEVPDITWTLCGTPDYLAPEVVASKGYNKSVDW